MKKRSFNFVKILKKIWVELVLILGLSISAVIFLFSLSSCTKEYNIEIKDNQLNVDSLASIIINNLIEFLPDSFGNINYYTINVEGDCNLIVIYGDENADSLFTDEIDVEIDNFYWCSGDATPEVDTNLFYTEEGCRVLELTLNGDLFFSDTTCPVVVPPDTVVVHDTVEIVRDTIIYNTITIERISITEYFDNPGNTPFFEWLGWILGLGFSANGVNNPNNSGGTLVQWDETVCDTAWSPVLLEGYVLDYISFRAGSSLPKHFFVLGLMNTGEKLILDEVNLQAISGFDWTDPDIFNLFEYSLDGLEGISRIGWTADTQTHQIWDRNQKWNADIFVCSGYKEIN